MCIWPIQSHWNSNLLSKLLFFRHRSFACLCSFKSHFAYTCVQFAFPRPNIDALMPSRTVCIRGWPVITLGDSQVIPRPHSGIQYLFFSARRLNAFASHIVRNRHLPLSSFAVYVDSMDINTIFASSLIRPIFPTGTARFFRTSSVTGSNSADPSIGVTIIDPSTPWSIVMHIITCSMNIPKARKASVVKAISKISFNPSDLLDL